MFWRTILDQGNRVYQEHRFTKRRRCIVYPGGYWHDALWLQNGAKMNWQAFIEQKGRRDFADWLQSLLERLP